jgi:hypothetical protein
MSLAAAVARWEAEETPQEVSARQEVSPRRGVSPRREVSARREELARSEAPGESDWMERRKQADLQKSVAPQQG